MRSPDPGAVTVNKTGVETPASKYLADPESEQPMIDADIDICLSSHQLQAVQSLPFVHR